MTAMRTTLTADFWTLFALLLTAGAVITVIATLAAETFIARLRAHRTPHAQARPARPVPRIRPRPLHHTRY
jgi:hypothetical protein